MNPVAVYGPAGAGKTHLTIALMVLCDELGLKWEVTSLTANRSVQMGGAHVHQLFRMCRAEKKCPAPRIAQMAVNRIKNVPVLRRYLQDLDVLFIDELCTLSAATLTAMEMILGQVRRSSQPFGNVQIICTADHHQLPPIGGRGQDESARSLLVQALFSSIKLTALVRCQCPMLKEVQRLMRTPTPNQAAMDRIDALLQEHCHVGEQPPEDVIYLFAHKEAVKERCKQVAESIPEEQTETFEAIDQELRWFQGAKVRNNEGIHHALDKYTTMPSVLTVWKGMQVMLRGMNPNPSIGLVNCALGKLLDFSKGDVDRPWVEVELEQPVDIPQAVRLYRKEPEAVLGPAGVPISRMQIPIVPASVWTMHMGQGMTLWKVATQMICSDRTKRMWERGQLYKAITRVHKLSDFWLLSYDRRLLEHLLALPNPTYHMVDEWIEATKLNARQGVVGPCCDPPGMPARIEEILRQPSRVIGSLAFPNDGMLVVYLLQQGGQPYRTYWGYSEQLCLRVAEHNSNGPRATKYTRGRTDWLLALYIGTFPNTKDGLKIAKEGKKDAKRRLLGLESSAQNARSRSKGIRALHDNVQLAYDVGRYLREVGMPPLTLQEEGLTKGTSCAFHCPMSRAS